MPQSSLIASFQILNELEEITLETIGKPTNTNSLSLRLRVFYVAYYEIRVLIMFYVSSESSLASRCYAFYSTKM